jgi:hypothetical protein
MRQSRIEGWFEYHSSSHLEEGAMSLDDVKKQFLEQVKLRAYDDKYIDKNEEREILQIALQMGVTVDSARAALAQVCEANDYVVESQVLVRIKEQLETFAENDGKIDEKEFNDTVSIARKATKGKKNDIQVKRMVLEVMADNSYKEKTGWFSNWLARVRKEVGMS